MKFRRHDFLVERLHDVFVGARARRARDVRNVVFGSAEHYPRRVTTGHAAQMAKEVIAVHHGHVPVEQHRFRHGPFADDQGVHTVFGLDDLKIESFQNTARDLSHDAGIIDNETGLHF